MYKILIKTLKWNNILEEDIILQNFSFFTVLHLLSFIFLSFT